ESPLGALERLPAGRSDLDDVPPAVARIATTLDEALVLQVVEQKDEVVGVEVQRLAELLLRRFPLVAQVVQRDVLLEAHAQQVLARAAIDDARQARQQHHRSGSRRIVHLQANRNIPDDRRQSFIITAIVMIMISEMIS